MAALETPAGAIGWQAKDFTLEDTYGNPFRLSDVKGPSGTLVMFICNHCPYVRAIAERIARDALDVQERGVSVIAVMPNDYVRYPDDAPEQMKRFAEKHNFSFPYVVIFAGETPGIASECHDAFPELQLTTTGRGRQPARSARAVRLSVFRDEESIRAGDLWLDRLQEAVDVCGSFVMLVQMRSLEVNSAEFVSR